MAPGPRLAFPRRGDVCLVSFDPTLGAEIKKTRPALVIQDDVANRWSPITIVAAISPRSDEPTYPTEVASIRRKADCEPLRSFSSTSSAPSTGAAW